MTTGTDRGPDTTDELVIRATDEVRLCATEFRPAGARRGALVIAPAIGVSRQYYGKFARYLSEAGFSVVTFDYRGMGQSGADADRAAIRMRDWAERDLAAVLRWARATHPDVRLSCVAHSIAGQLLGLIPEVALLDDLVLVGSQHHYWGHWRGMSKLWPMLFFSAVPLLVRLLGSLPMNRLGMGNDLPPGIALDWAAWGKEPNPSVSYRSQDGSMHFGAFRGGLRAYAMRDDIFAPPEAVEVLVALYTGARSDVRVVAPRDVGNRKIGHFGFFRQALREPLWQEARQWLTRVEERGVAVSAASPVRSGGAPC